MAQILLVEDDLDLRLLIENVLSFEAYDITAVESVTSACSLLDSLRFDLVIADLRLTDGNGITVVEKATDLDTKAFIITGKPSSYCSLL